MNRVLQFSSHAITDEVDVVDETASIYSSGFPVSSFAKIWAHVLVRSQVLRTKYTIAPTNPATYVPGTPAKQAYKRLFDRIILVLLSIQEENKTIEQHTSDLAVIKDSRILCEESKRLLALHPVLTYANFQTYVQIYLPNCAITEAQFNHLGTDAHRRLAMAKIRFSVNDPSVFYKSCKSQFVHQNLETLIQKGINVLATLYTEAGFNQHIVQGHQIVEVNNQIFHSTIYNIFSATNGQAINMPMGIKTLSFHLSNVAAGYGKTYEVIKRVSEKWDSNVPFQKTMASLAVKVHHFDKMRSEVSIKQKISAATLEFITDFAEDQTGVIADFENYFKHFLDFHNDDRLNNDVSMSSFLTPSTFRFINFCIYNPRLLYHQNAPSSIKVKFLPDVHPDLPVQNNVIAALIQNSTFSYQEHTIDAAFCTKERNFGVWDVPHVRVQCMLHIISGFNIQRKQDPTEGQNNKRVIDFVKRHVSQIEALYSAQLIDVAKEISLMMKSIETISIVGEQNVVLNSINVLQAFEKLGYKESEFKSATLLRTIEQQNPKKAVLAIQP